MGHGGHLMIITCDLITITCCLPANMCAMEYYENSFIEFHWYFCQTFLLEYKIVSGLEASVCTNKQQLIKIKSYFTSSGANVLCHTQIKSEVDVLFCCAQTCNPLKSQYIYCNTLQLPRDCCAIKWPPIEIISYFSSVYACAAKWTVINLKRRRNMIHFLSELRSF